MLIGRAGSGAGGASARGFATGRCIGEPSRLVRGRLSFSATPRSFIGMYDGRAGDGSRLIFSDGLPPLPSL